MENLYTGAILVAAAAYLWFRPEVEAKTVLTNPKTQPSNTAQDLFKKGRTIKEDPDYYLRKY